jgi:signal transduction histidine kinase
MTVMTLQAEGAKRIAEGSDPRVLEALETISQAGHGALAEMRRMVGLLRRPEDESETEPLPTLANLDHLVETVRAAGMPVDLKVSGKVRTLSEAKELSAYRIVQESLTNAVRHGGPEVRATVTLDYGNDQLDVQVVDDGRGASARSDGEGGHGIVGMRERIAVLGGEFAAGPNHGGGFRVHATIPAES